MKGWDDPMNKNAAPPEVDFTQDEPKKQVNPQDTLDVEIYDDKEFLKELSPVLEDIEVVSVYAENKTSALLEFDGYFRLAKNVAHIPASNTHPAFDVELPMYGNYINALSDTNKRYLEGQQISTDYFVPNLALFEALGIPKEISQSIVLVRSLYSLPIRIKVCGYNEDTGEELSPVIVQPHMLTGFDEAINREEAIRIIADYVLDNEMCLSNEELIEEFGTMEEAEEIVLISDAAREYGKLGNEDDYWEALEFALAYELAADFYKRMEQIAMTSYFHLEQRYLSAKFILANTIFTFGMDDETCLYITGEVGTMNNSYIVSKEGFGESTDCIVNKDGVCEDNKFGQTYLYALYKHIADGGSTEKLPQEVLDGITDTVQYIAEALVEDLEYDVYIN